MLYPQNTNFKYPVQMQNLTQNLARQDQDKEYLYTHELLFKSMPKGY